MKYIKDFLYNWNDIVVILLILASAAGLIYWRVNMIMDYPKTLASEIQDQGTINGVEIEMPEVTEEEEVVADPNAPGSGPADSDIWTGGRLYSNTSVEVPEGDVNAMITAFVDGGLFRSIEDYVAVCEKANVDSNNIVNGTFHFNAGCTQEDIVKQVTQRSAQVLKERAEAEAKAKAEEEAKAKAEAEAAQQAAEEEATEDGGGDTEETTDEGGEDGE